MPAVNPDAPAACAPRSEAPCPTVVVMAKPPIAGQVKTRLTRGRGGTLTQPQAAAVHHAMLQCVLDRLARLLPGRKVLALAGDRRALAEHDLALEGWEVIDQGPGNLGRRLDHAWQAIGGGAVAFFGIDSPDVPAHALHAIAPALARANGACGPAPDGGYWTLAATRYAPALLRGIDWGSASVYDQTRQAADRAGLKLAALPRWHDVDCCDDLADLRRRLSAAHDADPALGELGRRLGEVTSPSSSASSCAPGADR